MKSRFIRKPNRWAAAVAMLVLAGSLGCTHFAAAQTPDPLAEFRDPPREFSVMPFWFWNDDLNEAEMCRQIADFEAHGVYGFVIHARVGLPKDIGWMSAKMLRLMKFAVEEAQRRKMYVVLYDEGMYPSGSSAGQVVARNPQHSARALDKLDLKPGEEPKLPPGWNLVAVVQRPNRQRLAVVDRPSGGHIRGIHYVGEGPAEDNPPAGDILNPEAVQSFIHLVYDRYASELGPHFGRTILGIFTDEPSPQGRGGKGLPGTTGILREVNRILGYDFTPYLADLWHNDRPDSSRRRADYHRAIALRLEETFYRPISEWCRQHGTELTGHPAGSMDIGMERYFHIPGQDLVWRMVVPGKSAIEGPDSTLAKCASSAMVHLGRRRNSNELYGAYGHNLTFDEMEWLANWCFVRGQNLLFPHAFYYSVRGPRRDERPPDVGPNAAWWPKYKPYADACRRLSWLNTDSRHVCHVAVLADATHLPDQAAKICFQHQRDFNYLELRHLWDDAKAGPDGVRLAGMEYRMVVLDGAVQVPEKALPALEKLAAAGRLVAWGETLAALKDVPRARTPQELVAAIDARTAPDLVLAPPTPDVRYRHVVKHGRHFYLLFNEGPETATFKASFAVQGARQWFDPHTGETSAAPTDQPVILRGHEMKVLSVAE
jgi:hypothetical protein